MTYTQYVILYVDNPVVSAGFYQELLNKQPLETAPTFALFALENGLMFGLWSKHTVEPASGAVGEKSGELGFSVPDRSEVDRLHRDWVRRGLVMAQPPTDLDFGYTFVALDPDGHRLRVFSLTEVA